MQLSVTVAMQIGVFAFVAIASGWLASRVRAVGAEHEVLQAEVRRLRLEASDILHNISSGVLTVDAGGFLLFGNPAAEALLGMRAGEWARRPILDFLRERAPELWAAMRATLETGLSVQRAEGRIAFDHVDLKVFCRPFRTTAMVAVRARVRLSIFAVVVGTSASVHASSPSIPEAPGQWFVKRLKTLGSGNC